jgi:hypothetical protein
MLLSRKPLPILLALALVQGGAWGQAALRDPTQAPAGVALASEERSANAGGAPSAPVQPRAPVALQVLKIGPAGSHVVLDGKTLQPGDRIDQLRLTRITAQGVVLQGPTGPQTISAYPAVKKTAVSGTSPAMPTQNGKP